MQESGLADAMLLEDGSALACEQGSKSKLTMGYKGRADEKACFAEAIAASRLRCKERLVACVKALPEVVNQQDGEGAFLQRTTSFVSTSLSIL